MRDAWTLDDALNFGQGTERPFRCPEHDDSHASASVNVLKGVWVCYACQASGTVDGKKAPTAEQLMAMLAPEDACRAYPESWLDLFRDPGYWTSRFPEWLCWYLGFGEDPFTGDAVFPVRTEHGTLAGVGRRLAEPEEDGPRYKYPLRWSASRSMFGYDRVDHSDPVGILVEGAADNAAVREIGADCFSVYGSGVHAPQYELIHRLNKRLWLLGFDMDEAGDRAAERAYDELAPVTNVARIEWKEKDPADTVIGDRIDNVVDALRTVRADVYGGDSLIDHWTSAVKMTSAAFLDWKQEVA